MSARLQASGRSNAAKARRSGYALRDAKCLSAGDLNTRTPGYKAGELHTVLRLSVFKCVIERRCKLLVLYSKDDS